MKLVRWLNDVRIFLLKSAIINSQGTNYKFVSIYQFYFLYLFAYLFKNKSKNVFIYLCDFHFGAFYHLFEGIVISSI